jgi:hypothetical protein
VISPNDVATVGLGAAIANAAPQLAGAYGSIAFRYTAPVIRALYAAVMVELPGTPLEFHLDAFTRSGEWVTGSREGIWWQPRDSVNDWLILTNTANSALDANLVLYDSAGKARQQKLTLGARQTARVSVRSLLQQAGLSGSFGGIKIDVPNGAGYLDTAHVVFDEQGGFLALMKMFDHDPNGQRRGHGHESPDHVPLQHWAGPVPGREGAGARRADLAGCGQADRQPDSG